MTEPEHAVPSHRVQLCPDHCRELVVELAASLGLVLGATTPHDTLWWATSAAETESTRDVLGFISVRVVADEMEIRDVGVSAAARRSGVGTDLVQCALGFAREQGVRAAFLEVATHNQPAVQLYRKVGFEVLDVRRRYYENQHDALVMIFPFDKAQRPD